MDSWYLGNFVHFCELWLHSLNARFRIVSVGIFLSKIVHRTNFSSRSCSFWDKNFGIVLF